MLRTRLSLPTLLALALLVITPTCLAAGEAPADEAVTSPPAGTTLCTLPTLGVEVEGAEPLPLASLAECSAECEDGSTVTCSGSSCSAQDQDCSQDQAGYCFSDLEDHFCEPCDDPDPVICKSQGNKCIDDGDCPPCSNGDPCRCFGGTCGCA